LTPYEGFWLNVLSDRGVSVIYPNSINSARARTAAPRQERSAENAWQVRLVAASDGFRDGVNSFGVSAGAGQGYSRQDLEKPPPFGSYLQVSFPHRDWGARSGRYAVDLREPAAGTQTWDFEVEHNLAGRDITLTWPDANLAPRGVSLVLTDLTTGLTRQMQSTGSYTFRGDGQPRQFRIAASRGGGHGLSVLQLDLQQGAGRSAGAVRYTLSGPAEVSLFLTSPTGRRVRTIAQGRAAATGTDQVPFQAVDDQGRALPPGLYRLELLALGADGRQARTMRLGLVGK
jgi:hypothetical protein